MQYRWISGFRRALSLFLTVTLLLGCMTANAAEMRVELALSDTSAILPLGKTVTVEVKGNGTSAVSLMIVKPDSTQEFRYGEVHDVTFTHPGMYVLVGYGANGTDEKAASFARCMSDFQMVTIVGEAPEELQGELDLQVFLNLAWNKLDGAMVRRHTLPLLLTLHSQEIPEDSQLKLELLRGNQSVTVLEGSIGKDRQWNVDGEPAVRSLLSSQPYGQHRVQAVATLTAPDGQTLTTKADFSMGHYSPEMLYVNELFDDNWVFAESDMGRRLHKWLDMTPIEDGGDRTDSGYLMLEEEHEFQDEFWQKLGYNYVWCVEKASATIGSCGINLIVDAGNHLAHMGKFGRAGAYAQPYYDLLTQTYISYLEEIDNEVQDINDVLDIVCDGLEASYDIATMIIDYQDTETNTILLGHKKTGGDMLTLELQGFVNGKPSPNGRKMTEFSYKIQGSKEWHTATLSELAFGKNNYAFELKYLGKDQLSDLRESLRADKAYIEDCFGDSSKRNWAKDLDIKAFKGSVEQLVSEDSKVKLKPREREILQEAADSSEMLLNPSRDKLKSWGEQLNVTGDFISAVASAATLAQTVENATARQTLYANAFSKVTEQQLDMLWSWYDAIQNDAQIKDQNEKDRIGGAIYALACDVMLSHDKLKQQVMKRKNVTLESTEAIINTISDASEFFASLSKLLGKDCKEFLGNTKFTQLGTMKNVGGGGIMIAASLTNAVLNVAGAQYFDSRKKTTVLYDLKKFYTDHTLKLLDAYATNRNHADAVEIINNLYMVRQLKLAGEDYISLLYLSADLEKKIVNQIDELDHLPPEVTAILWNELKHRNSFSTNESARSHVTYVYGIFEASNRADAVWGWHRLYTPIGYYRQRWFNAVYQNTELQPMPAEFENVSDTLRVADSTMFRSVTYTAVSNRSWLTGDIPAYSDISALHKENVYLYQRDGLEVFIPQRIFEEYYIPAQEIVDKLLNEYSVNFNDLDPKKHQFEERMMWTNITHDYIESFPMFDQMEN